MTFKELTSRELNTWLQAGVPVNILDIRPSEERDEWQISGSIHADVYHRLKNGDTSVFEELSISKVVPVVTVCGGGKTSRVAAELLAKEGFNAYNLTGGMKGWSLSWNNAAESYGDFDIVQFRRTGKGCLSYLIASDDEAMVVDASLRPEVYEEFLEDNQLRLKYAVDTHIHADHLSRTRQLADKYGIKPGMPANEKLNYPFDSIANSQIFRVGSIEIKAIHTPGHTPESMCYQVADQILITGDTLFLNGVGRPDLKASKEEAEKKACQLFYSVHKLLDLDLAMHVMPGHTSSPVAYDNQLLKSTLKEELDHNELLQKDKSEFVALLLERIPSPPDNYQKIVEINISGDATEINPFDLEAGANRCAIS